MLLRLSRTAQANASGHCRACLAVLPTWRPIAKLSTFRPSRLPSSQRRFGVGPTPRNYGAHTTEAVDLVDETADNSANKAMHGITIVRTTAGSLTVGGPHRAWLERRLNRVTSSLPCKTPAGQDPEGQWSMEDDNDGVAQAIEAICVPQGQLKDHERAFALREGYLDSIHAVFWSRRLASSTLELAQVSEAQHDEETDHVSHIREDNKPPTVSESEPAEDMDVSYDPRGLPIHETDIEQLETGHSLEESRHAGPYRGPRKETHWTKNVDRIVQLVDDLMRHAVTERFCGKQEPIRRAMESLDGPWTALEMLKSEGYPRYKFAGEDPVAAAEGIKKANDHARLLFARWERAKWEEQVARNRTKDGTSFREPPEKSSALTTTMTYKICFNLLAQAYEPDVHTFNTLILGLMTVGEHRLARTVVDSFLQSKLMPTKTTIVAILYHYFSSNDILGFYHWIRRMIGLDSRGVGLRRVNWTNTEDQGETFLSWAQRENVSIYHKWLITRSWLGPGELEAIIKGLIFFGQGQHAAQILSISLRRGYAIQTTTFSDLLALIVSRLDHDAASLLVRGLCANAGDMVSLLLEVDSVCPNLLALKLRRVLDIYAVRLSTEMGTNKHNWWKTPVDSGENDARKLRRDVQANTALLLKTDSLGHINLANRFLPGMASIMMALRIKEISFYLKHMEITIKEINARIKRATNRINAAQERQGVSLAPKIQAWLRQRFSLQKEDSPIRMPFERYEKTLKLRRRQWAMAQLHILSEQVELLVGEVSESLSMFSDLSSISPEVRDAIYFSIPAVTVRSCVKLTHKHHGYDWLAAAQGNRYAHTAIYEEAVSCGEWSPQAIKCLQIEARVAVQASLHLSYLIKSEIARSASPTACEKLLRAYGTWRRVPIEQVLEVYEGALEKLSSEPEGRETRLVQPVARYWSPKTSPFYYLSST